MTSAALLCWIALGVGEAEAGGYYFSDSGVLAVGRGGAVIASADDQFAMYYNPAALSNIDVPTINVGMSLVQQSVHFKRMKADGTFFPELSNQAPPFKVPQGGVVIPFRKDLVGAVGFTSPFAPSNLWPADGPQRYNIIDSGVYQFFVGPSVAWTLTPAVTFGLGLQWSFLAVQQQFKVTMSGVDEPEGDIGIDVGVADAFTPNINLGLILRPTDWLSIGLAIQPETPYDARGQVELDFTGNRFEGLIGPPAGCAEDAKPEECPRIFRDDDIGFDLTLPTVLRAGIAVKPRGDLVIELATTYENWDVIDSLDVSDIDINLDVAILGETAVDKTLQVPTRYKDTASLRLGGQYTPIRFLSVRAGGMLESSAIEPRYMNVSLVDTRKAQIGGGVSVHLLDERLSIDTAFAFLALEKLQIRDSRVVQTNAEVYDPELPLPGLGPGGEVTGNGDVRSSGWVLGAQLRWAFRPLKKKTP